MGIFEFDNEETAPNTESQQWEGVLDFDDNLLFGYFFKDIVVLLLDKADYEVYPYGYESFFPNLKRRLYTNETCEVASRIRTTPDLLVRDSKSGEVDLVEVKARSATGRYGLTIHQVEQYLEFWPESVLVLVIPSGNFFYAQYVNKLEFDPKGLYYPREFRPLEEVFERVRELPSDFRCKMVRKARTLFRNRDYANI